MTKENKVLNMLMDNVNNEVSARNIAIKCRTLHHTELIRRLRDKWYMIANRTESVKKEWEYIKYSWYKLIMPEVKQKNWLQRILDFKF